MQDAGGSVHNGSPYFSPHVNCWTKLVRVRQLHPASCIFRFIGKALHFIEFFYLTAVPRFIFGENKPGMKNCVFAALAAVCFLSVGCNTATPEKYFDVAVLNVNTVVGFANDGLHRQLDQPSVKLVEGTTDQTTPMKRKEVIDQDIKSIEETLDKVKGLHETDETKEMLRRSIALYEYVLPVYKNEYVQLAKLYDENASPETIASATKAITDKYFTGFAKLHDQLMESGKLYADRHNIKVNWDVRTSPM